MREGPRRQRSRRASGPPQEPTTADPELQDLIIENQVSRFLRDSVQAKLWYEFKAHRDGRSGERDFLRETESRAVRPRRRGRHPFPAHQPAGPNGRRGPSGFRAPPTRPGGFRRRGNRRSWHRRRLGDLVARRLRRGDRGRMASSLRGRRFREYGRLRRTRHPEREQRRGPAGG